MDKCAQIQFEAASKRLHLGIDTIKFRVSLKPNNHDYEIKDLIYLVKDHFSTNLNHSEENPCIFYVKEQRAWLIFADVYPICRFYHVGNIDMFVECFGMFQAYDGSLLELNETHTIIFDSIFELRHDFNLSICKLDIAIDYFYDYKKSFVWFFEKSKENDVNKIRKQNDHDISYLGRFPLHTIEVPINRYDILNFIDKNHRKIKRKKVGKNEKRPTGSYYRFGTYKEYRIFKTLKECEQKDATHVQLKINDKNLFYGVKKLFKGQENWSYDFDDTEDARFSKSTPKTSRITYNKTQRDRDREKEDESEEHTHKIIRMDFANNDEELSEFLSNEWNHSRIELRIIDPSGVKDGEKHPDITKEQTFTNIFDSIKKKIKNLTIILIKPDVPNGVYIKHCREIQELQKKKHEENQKKLKKKKENNGEKFKPEEFIPKMVEPKRIHGRMLKPIENVDSIKSKLDMIKSFFIR